MSIALSPSSPRHSITRFLLPLMLALMVALQVQSASAGISWCRKDPIVSLNGTHVQVWVAIPAEYEPLIDGPIQVLFKTPKGMIREVVLTDEGFNGYGEAVSFADRRGDIASDGSFALHIEIRVSAGGRTDIPMEVEIVPGLGDRFWATGKNGGMNVKTRVVSSL